jgi:hypothetical protein
MKNQAQFTAHKSETWAAALSVYPVKVSNRAILEQGLCPDPFPDLSKILLRCEEMRRTADGSTPQGGITKISAKIVEQIAKRLEIEI